MVYLVRKKLTEAKVEEISNLFKIEESSLPSEQEIENAEYCESVLLSLIINSEETEYFYKAFDFLNKKDFINPFSSKIYQILVDSIVFQGLNLDKTVLMSKLDDVEKVKLGEMLATNVAAKENLVYFIDKVRNFSMLRELKTNLNNCLLDIQEPSANALKVISNLETSLLRSVSVNYSDFSTPKDIIPKILDRMKRENIINISSSFKSLDDLSNGLSDYIIIAARPSMGKTSLANHIMVYNGLLGKRSAMFSLEMNSISLTERIIGNVTEIPINKIKTGNLTPSELETLEYSISTIENLPIHIDQAGMLTVGQIVSKAKRLKIKYPDLALIVIDYIQLISTTHDDDNQESQTSEISKMLKNLSNSLNIPVIALSQLNRACEAREDKRPRLSDLRHSGSLEQDADLVIFIYGDWYYNKQITNNITELILAKNRNGSVGTVIVDNDKYIQKFRELS